MRYTLSFFFLLAGLFAVEPLLGQKVGLVLSGGGARGLAHIGAIKALEENNIPIDYITGTSAGALVGSMYARGLTPDQMIEAVLQPDFKKWASGDFDASSQYYFKKNAPDESWITVKLIADSTLHTQLPSNVVNPAEIDFILMQSMATPIASANYNFDSLVVPYRCVASDITAKKPVIFKSGDLALAVRASMAFPFYYPPVLIGENILYDGGIYNNFPTDIMLKEFNPDIIIGVSAAGLPDAPSDGNFLSQLKTMIVQTTVYSVPRKSDFIIEPDIKSIGVFDYDLIKSAIDSGYLETLRLIPELKNSITREADHELLKLKRDKISNSSFSVIIDQIFVLGVNDDQAEYIRRTLNPLNKCLTLNEFKKNWFKLVADDNQRYLFPRLVYNQQSGNYDLLLDVRKNKGIFLNFGGNVSSRPINTGFIGLQKNFWGKTSAKLGANIYFGKLYNSVMAKLRIDVPGKFPIYIEPLLSLNKWDYYKSSTAFTADVKPAFLVQNDRNLSLRFGMPLNNKALIGVGSNAFQTRDNYYLTQNFSESDTTDFTTVTGFSAFAFFERSTLNKKMYANKGSLLEARVRYINGIEKTTPGSTGQLRNESEVTREWFQMKLIYDNYFKRIGKVTLGIDAELTLSNQPLYSTYIASVSAAPSYQPLPDMQTRFLEAFASYNYLGIGLKNIYSFNSNFDIRFEGYVFQPYKEIIQADEYTGRLGKAFEKRYLLGIINPVYHSPIGPISISFNYYYKNTNPVSFMFHLGYIIFNKKALN